MKFLILLLSVASVLAKCPVGSILSTTYNTCYLISTNPSTWSAAESICKFLGGHLASVHSQEQNDYIVNLVVNNSVDDLSVFLGGNNVKNVWQNSDGSKFNFASFANGNKPRYNHSVVQMITAHPVPMNNGKWYVEMDDPMFESSFVCSIPPCGANGIAPSLLKQTDQNTGLYFGNITKAWYYGANRYDAAYEGEADCSGTGGHLASIHNAFENSQFGDIVNYFDMDKVDIGLTYVKGKWVWTDGSDATYTNWGKNQPSNGTNAVFNLSDQKWSSVLPNEFNRKIVCEYNPDYRKTYC